jgi:molybdopterin synthase catalytic subunit
MSVSLVDGPFDPWAELRRHQDRLSGRRGDFGATACFVGTMRDLNEGDAVARMVLEHYPGMTERHLLHIRNEACRRWDLIDAVILHRYGAIEPGEPIVLVAVWSPHRSAAFEACRFLIEELKLRAPLWKKEVLGDGERWVTHNSPP